MIDGLHPIESCYQLAGYVGLPPENYSLRELWMMAEGRTHHKRIEVLEIAQAAWTIGQFDPEEYLFFGQLTPTDIGGEVELTEEQQAEVQRKIQEIRAANPDAPKVKGTK